MLKNADQMVEFKKKKKYLTADVLRGAREPPCIFRSVSWYIVGSLEEGSGEGMSPKWFFTF